MSITKKAKSGSSRKMSTLWVYFTILDVYLHQTALLDVLTKFAEFGNSSCLIAVRSKRALQTKATTVRIVSVPLRYVPLISPVAFTIILFFFLPIFIIISRPDFIIFEPDVHILSSFLTLLISRVKKAKLILDIRSVPVETVGFRGFQRRFWFSASILLAKRYFDGMTIITDSMKKKICHDFDLNPDRIGVWTSGVSDSLFNPRNFGLESAKLRERFGLDGKFVVFQRRCPFL